MDGGLAQGREGLISRRGILRLGALVAGGAAAGGVLAACGSSGSSGGPAASASGGGSASSGGGGRLVFLSDQLSTTQETADFRTKILAGFKDASVSFTSFSDTTRFVDQVLAQSKAGSATLDLIGGLQGDFVALQAQTPLRDMSDVIGELQDRNFPQAFLDLAKIDGAYRFVPWITATYLMVANKKALPYLPSGADVNSLTYDQLLAWGQAMQKAQGQQLIGLPAGPMGLIKRLFQGYLYPSYTGALNTQFKSDAAASMWQYFKQLWAVTNPQSPTYNMMDQPLLTGEVWVAWDHAVRLFSALQQQPDSFVVFPAPSGPKGLGYEPVLGGLAIPSTSKNVTSAKALISYLTEPQVQATMINAESWFPPVGSSALPSNLAPGVSDEAKAIAATTGASNGLASQLPIGLGAQSAAYDKVFVDTFTAIALHDAAIGATLTSEAATLQSVLTQAKAACWQPDPAGTGVCQVG